MYNKLKYIEKALSNINDNKKNYPEILLDRYTSDIDKDNSIDWHSTLIPINNLINKIMGLTTQYSAGIIMLNALRCALFEHPIFRYGNSNKLSTNALGLVATIEKTSYLNVSTAPNDSKVQYFGSFKQRNYQICRDEDVPLYLYMSIFTRLDVNLGCRLNVEGSKKSDKMFKVNSFISDYFTIFNLSIKEKLLNKEIISEAGNFDYNNLKFIKSNSLTVKNNWKSLILFPEFDSSKNSSPKTSRTIITKLFVVNNEEEFFNEMKSIYLYYLNSLFKSFLESLDVPEIIIKNFMYGNKHLDEIKISKDEYERMVKELDSKKNR